MAKLNSSVPTTAAIVGGTATATPPAPVEGQGIALSFDLNGNLRTTSSGGGGGGNVNITGVNSSPPALSNPLPVELSDGTNALGTVGNPVFVSGGGSNASVGTTNATAPTSATEIGIIDGTGKLQGASSSNPVPTTLPLNSSPATQNITVQDTASTTTAQANGQNAITGTPTAGSAASFAITTFVDNLQVQVTGTWTGTLISEISFDNGVTWFSSGIKQTGSSYIASSFTGNFAGDTNLAGGTNYRVRATAAMTGTATVLIIKSAGTALVRISNAIKIQDATVQSQTTSVSAAGALKVDGSAVTQPISGTVTANQGTAAAVSAGWPHTAGLFSPSPVSFNSSTSLNSTISVPVQGFSTVIVTVVSTSTITGGAITFECADTIAFPTAYPVLITSTQAIQSTIANFFTLTPNTNNSFLASVTGWSFFRVRLSTAITGTGTVTIGISGSSAPSSSGQIINFVGTVGSIGTLTTLVTGNVRSTTAAAALADNQANTNFFSSSTSVNNPTAVGNWLYGGAFSGAANANLQGWSKARTPTVFKTASVNATTTGNSAVWTPGTGNKFRLLGFQITAQGLAATASAVVTVSFQDSASGLTVGTYDVDVPAVANVVTGVNQISGGLVSLGGFGVLSAAANNVLNFNISAAGAGTVGAYRVTAMGTEE